MLEAADLSVFYGRHRALEEVTIRVDRGEICVILGANGAGKSTLLKALAGLIHCEAGSRISVNGATTRAMKPSQIVEQGIALVPETSAIFGELTVGENLQLGAYPARARRNEATNLKRVYELFPVLAARRGQVARTMSGGEQKMLAVGRALMSEPDILMLDEPSLGLSPILTTQLFKALAAIGEAGVGVLLVEQNAKQSLKIADRGYLLENGHIVGEYSAMALASDPAVRRAYLGDTGAEPPSPQNGEVPEQSMSLAGRSATEIGSRASELAARAASIHAAHIQSTRASTEPRSDPTAEAGATEAPAMPASPAPSDLTRMAAALAERAGTIEAAYAESRRRHSPANGTAASAPAEPKGEKLPATSPEPTTDASVLTRMAEEFARHAAESRPRPNGGSTMAKPAQLPDARHGNGAKPTETAHALSSAAGELAARAAALDAPFLAEHRSVTPLTHLTRYDTDDTAAARLKKKHRHGKKKCKKSRKHGGKDKGD